MNVRELREKLLEIKDQEKDVTIVVGNEDDNFIDTYNFELHHFEDSEHPLEIFVMSDAVGLVYNEEEKEDKLDKEIKKELNTIIELKNENPK